MQRSFVAAATLMLIFAGSGGASAQSQPAAQPSQTAPKANLIPGGAAAAAPSFLDRLAFNFHSAPARADSDHSANQNVAQTAAAH
jgi:hypothetical protein